MHKILLSSIFALCAIAAQAQDEVSSVATFEETTLEAESHWFGDTDPEDQYTGVVYDFYSGRYMLTGTRHSSSWWSGFALSNETSTEYASLSDQFRSAAGGAHSGSNADAARVQRPMRGLCPRLLSPCKLTGGKCPCNEHLPPVSI